MCVCLFVSDIPLLLSRHSYAVTVLAVALCLGICVCHKLALCQNVLLDPALCYDEILVSKVPNKVLSSGFCPNL